MATRGRGRGRGLLVSRGNETKPGTKQEDVSDSSVTLTDISSSIKKLDVAPDDERIRSTCDLIKSYMSTEGRMSEVAEVIYKQCFNDRDFSYAASRLINTLQSYEVNGVKFRTAVLSLLQREFQGKEELRASSSNKFLAFVAFLCQLYGTVRVGNQEPMHVLTGPVYQCLSVIATTGNEEEVECIVYQLEGIGKLLEEKTSEEMSHFMEKVRQSVVSHRTSARVRCMLLELLETWFNKWQPLPPATANFYANLFSESLLSDS